MLCTNSSLDTQLRRVAVCKIKEILNRSWAMGASVAVRYFVYVACTWCWCMRRLLRCEKQSSSRVRHVQLCFVVVLMNSLLNVVIVDHCTSVRWHGLGVGGESKDMLLVVAIGFEPTSPSSNILLLLEISQSSSSSSSSMIPVQPSNTTDTQQSEQTQKIHHQQKRKPVYLRYENTLSQHTGYLFTCLCYHVRTHTHTDTHTHTHTHTHRHTHTHTHIPV